MKNTLFSHLPIVKQIKYLNFALLTLKFTL
jgi:hypothetical protein